MNGYVFQPWEPESICNISNMNCKERNYPGKKGEFEGQDV
jgi:hypothetical protein